MNNEQKQERINQELEVMRKRILNEANHLIQNVQDIKADIKAKVEDKNSVNEHFVFNIYGELQGNALRLDREIIAFEAFKKGIQLCEE